MRLPKNSWAMRRAAADTTDGQRRKTSLLFRNMSEIISVNDLDEIVQLLESLSTPEATDLAWIVRREATRRKIRDERLRERFDAKVVRQDDGCWIWVGSIGEDGYGRLYVGGTRHMDKAHRVALFFKTGRFPTGVVRHTCDVRACCNPDHVVEGTQLENVRDMIQKGRQVQVLGSRRGTAKLTEKSVADARREWAEGRWPTKKACADAYGVDESTMAKALCGQTWKHVPLDTIEKAKAAGKIVRAR